MHELAPLEIATNAFLTALRLIAAQGVVLRLKKSNEIVE
jgi:hypothetical protein